jgi:branched-subunit amino acid transport protein
MNIWLIIVLGGILTVAIRLSFIFFMEKIKVPDWFKRSLRFIPSAILSAIILPGLVAPNGTIDFSFHNTQLIAGALAVVVAWRTKNVLLTILVGVAVLIVLQLLLGQA